MVKNLTEASDLFWTVLMSALGASTSTTPPLVRKSWNVNGSPDWSISDDVIFMQLTDESRDDITQPMEGVLADKGTDYELNVSYTRVLTLSLTAYGPNSYSNLLKLLVTIGRGDKALRGQKIYSIPEPANIQRAPELFQGRWWERADLTMRFNCFMVNSADINRITTVPVTINLNNPGSSEKVTTVTETITRDSGIIIKKG